MKVLITGATGFVGQSLVKALGKRGHQINILTTRKNLPKEVNGVGVESFFWNPETQEFDRNSLVGVEYIFHLAGDSIADGRWSDEKKKRLKTSRVDSFDLILKTLKETTGKDNTIKKVISSAAIGIYGNRGDEELTEESVHGTGFLAKLCEEWESKVKEVNELNIPFVALRTGVVLDTGGGALAKMILPFKMGVGGILADGKQYMSWIHREELVNMFVWAMETESAEGIYNAVSDKPVTNYDFTKALGRAISRPTIFPVPGFVLKTIFGEMSSILLDSQRVLPSRFLKEGYEFKFKDIDQAFADIFSENHKGFSSSGVKI